MNIKDMTKDEFDAHYDRCVENYNNNLQKIPKDMRALYKQSYRYPTKLEVLHIANQYGHITKEKLWELI